MIPEQVEHSQFFLSPFCDRVVLGDQTPRGLRNALYVTAYWKLGGQRSYYSIEAVNEYLYARGQQDAAFNQPRQSDNSHYLEGFYSVTPADV